MTSVVLEHGSRICHAPSSLMTLQTEILSTVTSNFLKHDYSLVI